MIDSVKLKEAAEKNQTAFEDLQQAYDTLPETLCHCDNIGKCCISLPEMTVLEALQWMVTISGLPNDERTSLIDKFVDFYLTGLIRHPGCPFCVEGSCTIYAKRPFACRAYGLWSPKMGEAQTRKNRDAQTALTGMWEKFGVPIPEGQLVNEMDYCLQVETVQSASISDDELLKVLERVYLLSQPIAELQQSFETLYQSDFSYLMASLVLGQKKAFLGKYAVVKEIVTKGAETRLNKLRHMASERAKTLEFP